ncbi:hypothetical protein [Deinococcus soli (ex Cha et al. 2016)]|uniref:Uncharacterized protein n=2 Tax=Deinococcus soli (ex Cha et al. 2016) TaxID=1309411 RepID=A0ACC6KKC8_9DEIO|nr:hypothetical protein [Deinococcus soli (ex Cha et al. 2016)]MDR6218625.1 hypothetical protein [Deinococcus soli (ex Cha et al. 2016)]MDR6328422.1 hypothetical protein [Deinococcus soli (ex Cha et al. 2016)]MDR6753033.1 hypothetical protein [Deinococcus soli (ex Cha et al. 2016)]
MTRPTQDEAQVDPGPPQWSERFQAWHYPTSARARAAAWCAERGVRTTRNPGEILNEHGVTLQVPTRYVLWSPDLRRNLLLHVGHLDVLIVAVTDAQFAVAQAMQALHDARHDLAAMQDLDDQLRALTRLARPSGDPHAP